MRFHYSLNVDDVINESKFKRINDLLKPAGVTDIWLLAYFTGRFQSSKTNIRLAADILKKHGFRVGIINIPVGHPGNALDPEDNSILLELPKSWRYRIDKNGNKVYFCADIENQMIHDNLDAIRTLSEAGFTRFFMDDDIRLGNWGKEIQGCFCDSCIEEFNHKFSMNTSRTELRKAIKSKKNKELIKKWVQYNCEKLTDFIVEMKKTLDERSKDNLLGIMVMHLGDERHGIDLKGIVDRIPEIHIRIGENHFDDGSMRTPMQRADELFGMLLHLNFINIENAYSETTIFPPNSLSPENWIFKAKMAAMLGLRNLFLMGGSRFIAPRYWEYLKEKKEDIYDLSRKVSPHGLFLPIHVLIGDYTTEQLNLVELILAGLPILPLNISAINGSDKLLTENHDAKKQYINLVNNNSEEAKIPLLYIQGGIDLKPDQETITLLKKYKGILVSKRLAATLERITQSPELKDLKIYTYNYYGERISIKPIIKKLKKLCSDLSIPFIAENKNSGIFPIDNTNGAVLVNFDNKDVSISLVYKYNIRKISLKKHSFQHIKLP